MTPIYLDHNATTPVDPEVIEAMLPYLGETFGNASSVHQFGRSAKVALERSREQIAAFINCEPSELTFTSGGTESDNLAVMGIGYANRERRNHLIVGAAEHHAVLESAEFLHHKEGFGLDLLPVDREGFSSTAALEKLVTDRTALVSVMLANNETGAIQDIPALARVAHHRGTLMHTDAVQAVGKVKVDVKELDVDLLSLTAHKIYGPKGIGALFVRQGIRVRPLLYGGSHEKKRRPGTENVAGAVGLAKALEVAGRRMHDDHETLRGLTNYFIDAVLSRIPDTVLNGPRENRLVQTANISFKGVQGEPVILSLDMENIAVASGSACTSGSTEPSHVLTAMGLAPEVALGAIRFSLGRSTTKEKLDHVLSVLGPIIERLRSMSPSRPSRV
ncbi:cysteine desulfurase NifS [candidate division GN15 bacterium]|uniref:cysteine desulfurase n=1 Tax=candidate division GN15 bacterium TaxID=2072418 RepID=A0A855X796_9BACT|nr:MAG: cysteine desulfurase NifS [candidate division GN15 bacterium]